VTEGLAPRPLEVELKYLVDDVAAGARLLAADELGGLQALGPANDVHHEDRYLDTPDAALAAAGYAARLRRTATGTLITLKGLARQDDGGTLHRRDELEGPADPAQSPAMWPESAARDQVVALAGDRILEELVVLRQLRRKRLYGRDGAVVEVSLDEVQVVARGELIDRFTELEAELRDGDEAVLGSLAAVLAGSGDLKPVRTSKLERALDAVQRTNAPADEHDGSEPSEEPRLTAGKSPGVLTDDHLAEAGRKILRFHLARMVAREPGTREGTRNKELHGMRVATRRQRAAWRVFGDAFDDKRTARHQRRLRDVARDLGAVRDLDVLIEAAEAYQRELPPDDRDALEPLLAAWRDEREDARQVLIKELDSGRYQRWVDEYIDFVQTEGSGVRSVGPVEAHRVRDTMPSRIWAAYEGVRAYEPVMRWADVTTLHELRIAAKWLRYTIEFVREALGSDAGPVIDRVVAMQDHLGWMHDADVAAGLARSFLVEHAGDLTEEQASVIGRYLVDRERELARLRRSVGPVWEGVASQAFRRALGRLVAHL